MIKISEIAPYLPYKLKCEVTDMTTKVIAEMHSVHENGSCTFYDIVESEQGFDAVKPILKPLSKFKEKDIVEVKEYLGLGQWCDHYDQYFDAWFDDIQNTDVLVLQAPWCIMQYFLDNHYDVFGLIKRGLAIEEK